MTVNTTSGRLRPGRLTEGQLHRFWKRYRFAHSGFASGDFRRALSALNSLRADLLPHFVEIVRNNIGEPPWEKGGDLSDPQVADMIEGKARRHMRADPTSRESKTAALCSAVAHDAALIARHLSENTERAREPEVIDAILRGFAHAIAVAPNYAANYHNLGGYFDFLGRPHDASRSYEIAVGLDQYAWETWANWGHSLARMGNWYDAELNCWKNAFMIVDAIERNESREARSTTRRRRWGMSMLRLQKGDYAKGWDDYEGRWDFAPYLEKHGRADITAPMWDGTPTSGTILIHLEQGVGDALMLSRWFPHVAARAGRVILEVIPAIEALFRAMFPSIEFTMKGEDLPAHDFQVPSFSLPHIFGARVDDLVEPAPFRVVSSENSPIHAERGRIGLCWAGSKTHVNDLVRSMPFEHTFPLLDMAAAGEIKIQSLQFGYLVSEPLEPLPPGDFLETARAVARCELVVTVDTSIAHLAGAMDVPTWLLLPHHCEWRWLQSRSTSPWYPSLRLYRQGRPGDWGELIHRAVSDLRAHLERAR